MAQNTSDNRTADPRIELRPAYPHRPTAAGDFHLLISITAPELRDPQRDRPPLDLAFVVDRSGSMAGEKLPLVKRGVDFALSVLDERDTVSLTIYDNTVETLTPQQPFSAGTRQELSRRLAAVHPRGSTALADGWLRGCDQLAAIADHSSPLVRREGRPVCRTLLLTDGLANVGLTDPRQLATHATELHNRGISTTTFGVGDDFDEVLLAAMADAGGGRYHYIAQAADIPAVFAGELGELLQIAARDVTLTLRFPASWTTSLINDLPLSSDGKAITVSLGDLTSRDTRTLIVEATLPAAADGALEAVEARLAWSDPLGSRSVEQVVALTLTARDDPGVPDEAVLDELAEVIGARAQADALVLNRVGRYEEAAELLNTAQCRLPGTRVGMVVADELARSVPEFALPLSARRSKNVQADTRCRQRQLRNYLGASDNKP